MAPEIVAMAGSQNALDGKGLKDNENLVLSLKKQISQGTGTWCA